MKLGRAELEESASKRGLELQQEEHDARERQRKSRRLDVAGAGAGDVVMGSVVELGEELDVPCAGASAPNAAGSCAIVSPPEGQTSSGSQLVDVVDGEP